MLTKPYIPDEKIAASLFAHYGLQVNQLTFLPRGTDQATTVYRLEAGDERPCFLKLHRSGVNALAVALRRSPIRIDPVYYPDLFGAKSADQDPPV